MLETSILDFESQNDQSLQTHAVFYPTPAYKECLFASFLLAAVSLITLIKEAIATALQSSEVVILLPLGVIAQEGLTSEGSLWLPVKVFLAPRRLLSPSVELLKVAVLRNTVCLCLPHAVQESLNCRDHASLFVIPELVLLPATVALPAARPYLGDSVSPACLFPSTWLGHCLLGKYLNYSKTHLIFSFLFAFPWTLFFCLHPFTYSFSRVRLDIYTSDQNTRDVSLPF